MISVHLFLLRLQVLRLSGTLGLLVVGLPEEGVTLVVDIVIVSPYIAQFADVLPFPPGYHHDFFCLSSAQYWMTWAGVDDPRYGYSAATGDEITFGSNGFISGAEILVNATQGIVPTGNATEEEWATLFLDLIYESVIVNQQLPTLEIFIGWYIQVMSL